MQNILSVDRKIERLGNRKRLPLDQRPSSGNIMNKINNNLSGMRISTQKPKTGLGAKIGLVLSIIFICIIMFVLRHYYKIHYGKPDGGWW